jgi:hypothetical protein
MIVTGKHLPRRTFLKGLGATIALPMLDAMTPAFAGPAMKRTPTRLAFTYIPNGVTLEAWTPAAWGRDFAFTRILKPLEPLREHALIITGLAQQNANALADGAGDHARAAACYLTGVHPRKTAGADIQAGISVDQIAATAIGGDTRFPSIELGCDESRTVGNCDSGYSCAYTNSLSWRSPTSPMPPETNPRLAFERLFGGLDAGLDPATRALRRRERRSILDLVAERTNAIVGTLGPSDRRKMDEYLTSVREIERRIEITEHDTREVTPDFEMPSGVPVLFADYASLMFDMQAIAFQADLTRVSTLMLGREGSLRTYPEIGVPDPHHPLTHHRDNPEWIEKVTKVNVLHMELFAKFLTKLATTPDGDGTLLDHSIVIYGSGIADGNKHTHEDLPIVVAGHGGGLLGGRHLVYPTNTPMTNFYLTMLDRIGVKQEMIGDSTGRIEHLTDV